MRKSARFSVLLAALATVWSYSRGTAYPAESAASAPSKPGPASGKSLQKPKAVGAQPPPCSAFRPPTAEEQQHHDPTAGAARAMLERFLPKSSPDPKHRSPEHLKKVIAIVPDPRHTHLAILFDRDMEVIEAAAQDDGYTYDSSWLPWAAEPSGYPLRGDELAEESETHDRETCPGILLFRNSSTTTTTGEPYSNGLLIYLVGEQPTTGVSATQWGALKQINIPSLGPFAAPLVLGPNFSGSLPSLARLLQNTPASGQVVLAAGGLSSLPA